MHSLENMDRSIEGRIDQGKGGVLYIPRWFPSELDPQLGVFVAKHAQAVAASIPVAVLYAVPDPGAKSKYRIQSQHTQGVYTLVNYYRPARQGHLLHPLLAAWCYYKAAVMGWRHIVGEWGTPEVLHAHVLLRPVVLAALISLRWKIPYVVTEHWTGYVFGFFQRKPAWYRFLARFLVRRASCLTVVSESLRKAMIDNGFRHPCFRIVPNVVEVDGNCEERSLGKERPLMLTVADLVERNKDVSGVLRALHALVGKGHDIEYHIIGGGEDQDFLRTLAQDLSLLNRHVFFHGRRDNAYVLQFIRKCDFMVTNSRVETFSVATAEALACGKPVIATICGGPEFFVDESNGILIEPGNQAQLEDAIVYMLSHYQDYDRRKLRSSIEAQFSPEAVSRQFVQVYQEAMKR